MILLFWRCGTKYVINEITLENPLVKCSHSLIFSSCFSLIKKTIDKNNRLPLGLRIQFVLQ